MADGVGVSAEVGTQEATVPALFVVGPQRTGTSWIYEYLASEPGVYLDRSRKENYFFDRVRPHSVRRPFTCASERSSARR